MTPNKKFDRQSIRLKNYNYAANGYYFVTICTHEKQCFFGNIIDRKMQLSTVGKIAHQYWSEIPQHSKHTYLDEFIIMPNYLIQENNNKQQQQRSIFLRSIILTCYKN